MKIVTDTYSHSAAECGRRAAMCFLEKWWWAFVLPLLCALAASLWDWRWIVAALALALVAYPFVLMMAFYTRALTPQAAKATLKRHVEISDAGIEIVYEPIDEESSPPENERIQLSDINRVDDRGDHLSLLFSEGELIIPVSAIGRSGASDLMAFLSSKGIALR